MTTVSVVVPVYNSARYLREAIESVLQQTYMDWEMLLVDDGSSDGSCEIAVEYVKQFAPKVQLLFHPDRGNHGVSATRNLAIQHASGQYLAFLDADDVWLPHKLERQIDVVTKRPEVGLVYGQAQCIDANGEPVVSPVGPWRLRGVIGSGLERQPARAYEWFVADQRVFAPCPTVLGKTNLVRACGGFRLGLTAQIEDYLLWTEVSRLAPVYYVPETLALYRVHADTWTARQTPLSILDADWEYLITLAKDIGGADRAISDKAAKAIRRYRSLSGTPHRTRWSRMAHATAFVLSSDLFGPRTKLHILRQVADDGRSFRRLRAAVSRVGTLLTSSRKP